MASLNILLKRPSQLINSYRYLTCTGCKLQNQTTLPDKKKQSIWEWKIPQGYDTNIKVKNSYQSLGSRKTRLSAPLIIKDPKCITWYSCGPTVYSSSHIGHAVSYIRFDAIRRILTDYFGYKVNMVMGITDIDDKIIARANLLGKEFLELAKKYEIEFKEDLELLNVFPPSMFIKVSDVLPQIMTFIDRLLKNGYAYESGNGNVWFDIDKFTSQERLNPHQEEYISTEVYELETHKPKNEKRGYRDFALWKKAKPGEPYWETPWGNGRPGWHVECSTISSLVFGNHIDIHTGGCDLRFPHHECEIFQSEAYHGCEPWVNYFLHTGKLMSKGSNSKMSKSLGNVITIREFLRDMTADHLRYISLCSNWFDDVEYSEEIIEESKAYIQFIQGVLVRCQQYIQGGISGNINSVDVEKLIDICKTKTDKYYRENFDTAKVLKELMKLSQAISKMFKFEFQLDETGMTEIRDSTCITKVLLYLTESFEQLGFESMAPTFVNMKHISGQSTNPVISNTDTSKYDTLLNDYAKFRNLVKGLATDLNTDEPVDINELKKKIFALTDIARDDFKKRNLDIKDDITNANKFHITHATFKKKKDKKKKQKD